LTRDRFTHHHQGEGITANAVMPGAIMTDLQRHLEADELRGMGWADEQGALRADLPGWKSVEQGAATTVWAATAPELAGLGGRYLDDCAFTEPWTADEVPPSGHYLPYLLDADDAQRLWDLRCA
jgi:NAD(P)-dependent dehydrogenase (short-subunit alcohol dehydrogenase family)